MIERSEDLAPGYSENKNTKAMAPNHSVEESTNTINIEMTVRSWLLGLCH